MNRFPYFRATVILLGVIAGLPMPAGYAREWIDQPVIAAAGRVLAPMPDDYFTIRPAAAAQEIAAGATLVLDVREAGEFTAERIATARNLPIRQLAQSINTLPDNKAAPILVYCRSGHRGAMALTVLRMAGYGNVRSIAGGLEGWKAAGLAVAK
jgi:rhodanese-related sulfurtransferase